MPTPVPLARASTLLTRAENAQCGLLGNVSGGRRVDPGERKGLSQVGREVVPDGHLGAIRLRPGQQMSVQERAHQAECDRPLGGAAVGSVAQHGMPDVAEVHADLMGTSRLEPHLEQRAALGDAQTGVVSDGRLPSRYHGP